MDRIDPETVELLGFNSELTHRNITYHIQTQNLGSSSPPCINTLVFVRGALVHKVSSSLDDLENTLIAEEALEKRVKEQHQAVLNRVERGDFATR